MYRGIGALVVIDWTCCVVYWSIRIMKWNELPSKGPMTRERDDSGRRGVLASLNRFVVASFARFAIFFLFFLLLLLFFCAAAVKSANPTANHCQKYQRNFNRFLKSSSYSIQFQLWWHPLILTSAPNLYCNFEARLNIQKTKKKEKKNELELICLRRDSD